MAYGGEVASLFIRLRPNLSGFKAEATAGVKSALAGMQEEVNSVARSNVSAATRQVEANRALAASYKEIGASAVKGSDEARVAAKLAADATVAANDAVGLSAVRASEKVGFLRSHILNLSNAVGIGFGAAIGIKFVKDITAGAASVQKSVEVIKNTFGSSASEVVVKFGDTVASRLGISAQLADATSAKFGILFRTLGIGPSLAARMTLGFEKLAGSISAIKGVDPALVMQNLTLAAAGNTRGLKQLGVVVDANTEKIAAYKLGLISSVKDALTPAQKSIAIYALATAHLAQFQAQAAKHADDYANVQRRLSAEWNNAKDLIGTALLPLFDEYTGKLAAWLQRMIQSGKLQKDVNQDLRVAKQVIDAVKGALELAIPIVKAFADAVGGAANALKILLGLLGAKALFSGLTGLQVGMGGIKTKAGEAVTKVDALKLALLNLSRLGTIAVVIDVIEHIIKNKTKAPATPKGGGPLAWLDAKLTGAIGHIPVLNAIQTAGTEVGDAIANALLGVQKKASDLPSLDVEAPWLRLSATTVAAVNRWKKATKDSLADYRNQVTKAKADLATKIGDAIFNQGVADAVANAKQRLANAIQSGNASIAAAQQSLGNFIVAGQQRLADQIKSSNAKVSTAAVAAAANLNAIGKKLSDTIGKFLSSGAQQADIEKGPLGQQFARLRAAIASGRGGTELINAAQELASQLQAKQAGVGDIAKQKAAVTKTITGLADELNRGLISVKTFDQKVRTYLAAQGISYAKIGKALGRAQGDAYLAELNAILKQAGIIGAEPKDLRDATKRAGAGQGPKVIDPNAIRAAEDRRTQREKDAYERGLRQHEAAVGKAEQKAADRVAAARHAEVVTLQREHLRQIKHQIDDQKKATVAARKAAKSAAQTAATNAAIAATTVNTSGFPSATTKNPGVTATKARHGAAGGLTP